MIELYDRIYKKLNLGDSISEDYKEAIKTTVETIIDSSEYRKQGKIAVIPLETGGGKSSITNLTLAWIVKNDYVNSGTIILKERIEDCDATVKDINQIAGKKVAIAYHSGKYEDKNPKRRGALESELKKSLMNYPVLVMTHEGFKHRRICLIEYIYWKHGAKKEDKEKSREYARLRLIIDEQPCLLTTYKITNESLWKIEQYVQTLANKVLYQELSNVTNYIRGNCFVKRIDLETVYWDKCNFQLSSTLDDAIYVSRNENIKDIYAALQVFCNEGGFINYSDREEYRNLTIAKYIDIFDPVFNTVVLDGTSRINFIYKNDFFKIVDMPCIKTYKNTNLSICRQLTGSRKELSTNTAIIEASLKYIMAKVPKDEPCLLITHMDIEQDFLELGLPENIHINHYGAITGTNRYINYKWGYYIGVPYYHNNIYKLAYHLCHKNSDYGRNQHTVTRAGVYEFVDPDYNNTRNSMIAVELVQAINRIRCRKWNDGDTLETFAFLLNKDDNVIDLVKQAMVGVNIVDDTEFYTTLPESVREVKKELSIDILIRKLNAHKKHAPCTITKKAIFETDERLSSLKDKRKSELWKHPAVKQFEDDKIIKMNTKTIDFLCK